MLWLLRADFWFNCSETLVKQLIDFSRHIEVARVHLRQVILVTCIISGSGKFLDDSLSTVLVTHEKTRLHRMRVAVAVGVTIPNLGRIFFQINRVLTGNESVPIQITQCWFPGLAIPMLKYEYFFQIKYTEAILSSSTRKLLWFKITKC